MLLLKITDLQIVLHGSAQGGTPPAYTYAKSDPVIMQIALCAAAQQSLSQMTGNTHATLTNSGLKAAWVLW